MNTSPSNTLATTVLRIQIQNLRAQAELLRLKGESLARELTGTTTDQQKAVIIREWQRTTWARHSAKIKADRLDLL